MRRPSLSSRDKQAPMTIRAEGHNGQIAFDGYTVTITRKGFLARASVGKGEKSIPLASVVSVQWKPAGGLVNGFLQLETAGQGGTRSRAGSQTTNAARDENSVIFTRRQMPQFEQLRMAVDQALTAMHRGHAPQQPAPASVADELAKLGALYQQGLLSAPEFAAQKARLLG